METQTVQSYQRVRSYKQEANPTDNTMGFIIGAASVIMLAVAYWYIVLPVALVSTGAVYGVKMLTTQSAPVATIEAVTAPVNKPKRHYAARLTINNYQTGKSVRV